MHVQFQPAHPSAFAAIFQRFTQQAISASDENTANGLISTAPRSQYWVRRQKTMLMQVEDRVGARAKDTPLGLETFRSHFSLPFSLLGKDCG
jgi:hypothetical protein